MMIGISRLFLYFDGIAPQMTSSKYGLDARI
jgi:hypothetical protein